MILIHKICIALSGFGSLNSVDKAISVSAAILLQKQICHKESLYL